VLLPFLYYKCKEEVLKNIDVFGGLTTMGRLSSSRGTSDKEN